jgi:hypothetical protein
MFILKLSLSLAATQVVLLAIIWFRLKHRRRDSRNGLFGINNRSIDPITTLLALEGHKELRLDIHPNQAREGIKDAIRICVDAIQSSFGVLPYTDPKLPGLTVTEMLNLLDAFVYYCNTQKKNTDISQTLQPVSEVSTSNEFTDPTTASSLVSGSIEVGRPLVSPSL